LLPKDLRSATKLQQDQTQILSRVTHFRLQIPTGTFHHNVELYPGRGGQLARAAGNAAQLMAKENEYALLRLPSGELRKRFLENCMATIGQVGNLDHENVKIGKSRKKTSYGLETYSPRFCNEPERPSARRW
jgi:ribosomal protein L2